MSKRDEMALEAMSKLGQNADMPGVFFVAGWESAVANDERVLALVELVNDYMYIIKNKYGNAHPEYTRCFDALANFKKGEM